ncbi:concanavalin A-like lectin/glucanase [Mollisia scopiformis]|uniref:Concanavalin A-like lectin/glucanase n=1 Tax=Mollisia scopiformis TaxID=149040 RepID=A0A132B320_MOLSC|nr:concanavalin A-like lectin/glucanase [Mollisia scopiformis]KUJ06790.1 concanavalin A-like lectin/glucanase [Mollisia scopiformis]
MSHAKSCRPNPYFPPSLRACQHNKVLYHTHYLVASYLPLAFTMKILYHTIFFAFIGISLAHPRKDRQDYGNKIDYNSVWRENFMYEANIQFSSRDWNVAEGFAPSPGNDSHLGPERGSNVKYDAGTASLRINKEGNLVIQPTKDDSGQWLSGKIETVMSWVTKATTARLFEARIKVGDALMENSQGIWPRIYLMGKTYNEDQSNWPRMGEIDIFGLANGGETFTPTIHCGEPNGGLPCSEPQGFKAPNAIPFSRGSLHTVGLLIDRRECPAPVAGTTGECWEHESISWFLDEEPTYKITGREFGDRDAWQKLVHEEIIIGLAVGVGGDGVGPPNEATTTGESVGMEIDYVGVWEAKVHSS